ncbi:MAG: SRPBCC family protein [Saprospiraceae bacterium]|nr:SRPBCC family protein [Saprospiraceae bacterium]
MDSAANNFAMADMAIRKPIDEVFEAFIDPAITTKFWFTKSSGKLEAGKQVEWTWEMYNLTVPVFVKEIQGNEKISLEMGSGDQKSSVEWQFKALNPSKTFVTITNYDLPGTGDDLINQIRDSTGGFTIVLAGLKAYLEHGIELNLVLDKYPKELMESD